MLVVLRVFGLLARRNRRWMRLFHRVPVRGPWVGETPHRVWVLVSWGVCVWSLEPSWGRGQVVCVGGIRRARPLPRHRLRDEGRATGSSASGRV